MGGSSKPPKKPWYHPLKKFYQKYKGLIEALPTILQFVGPLVTSVFKKRIAIALLSLSATGFVGIAQQEGFFDKARIPVPGDVPTLGFGATKGVKMGDTTTPVRAMIRLLDEVEDEYGAAVKRCVKVDLYQSEYDQFVDLAYNVGPTNFCNSTLVKFANEGEYGKACGQLVRFVYGPGRKPLRGLQNRRVKEYLECIKDHQ